MVTPEKDQKSEQKSKQKPKEKSNEEKFAEYQAELRRYNKAHHRAELHTAGESGWALDALDRIVLLTVGEESVELDKDDVIRLQKRLQEAFQVVA